MGFQALRWAVRGELAKNWRRKECHSLAKYAKARGNKWLTETTTAAEAAAISGYHFSSNNRTTAATRNSSSSSMQQQHAATTCSSNNHHQLEQQTKTNYNYICAWLIM